MTGLKLLNESGIFYLLHSKRHSIKMGGKFVKELEIKLYDLIEKAVKRAKDNQRNTVMDRDI